MDICVNIKSIGVRYGTSGWLKDQIESGKIRFEESNDYYIPFWSSYDTVSCIRTHGLIMRDDKNSALIAYRNADGEYRYNINDALGCEPYSHWCLSLTEAAKDSLRTICEEWIEKVESEEQ